MLEGLLNLFARRPLASVARDVADVAIVAWVLYRALLVLRGTRAQQVAVGLVMVAALYGAARWCGLVTLTNLLDLVVSSLVLILVVVFQNDIRRALMRVGDKAWLPGLGRAREAALVDEVVAAATELARHRTGAIITFEQNANLDEFVVGQGIALDAAVTRELLVTIFQPESVNKLHDGAVLIRSLRLASAGVFFPMPEARNLDPGLGSRHRAALGISEETDAVVVVVSEERGTITVCFRGNMIPGLDGQRLRVVLDDLLGYKAPPREPRRDVATDGRVDGRPDKHLDKHRDSFADDDRRPVPDSSAPRRPTISSPILAPPAALAASASIPPTALAAGGSMAPPAVPLTSASTTPRPVSREMPRADTSREMPRAEPPPSMRPRPTPDEAT